VVVDTWKPNPCIDKRQLLHRERYYPGYYDYNYSGPTVYSGRRYYGPPDVYQRRSYRKRNRDWD
jgi:hypothetical protein